MGSGTIQKVLKHCKRWKPLSHKAYVFLKYSLLYLPAQILYRKRNIWLISERGTDARDNGYHFYRYIRTEHPEIEAYYVITPDSVDRPKIAEYGNLVNYRSVRHYMLCAAAKYLVSSHYLGATPDVELFSRLRSVTHHKILRGKVAFLQHGIIKDDISWLYQERTLLDLFICGAEPEYDYVSTHYHYHNQEVQYTGLARYDCLMAPRIKRQILLMPTWRYWLIHSSTEEVISSEYAARWNSLLHSDALKKMAEDYDYQIVFYPHYEMQKHLSAFAMEDDRIIIADFDHYDVQTLLKESALLITDYSSVFFDFAYMKKPMLYYQFDEERFSAEHYHKGYFDYCRDGFGEVVTEEMALLQILDEYMRNACRIKPEYESRVGRFFPLRDAGNCRRIYDEIIKL